VSPYHSGTVYGTTRADAVVTSLLAAPLADNYGRRMTLRSGAFVFTLGGAIQTFCNGFWMMSMVVPIYQVSGTQRTGQRCGPANRAVGDFAGGSCERLDACEGHARADTRSEAYWARSSSRGTSSATPRLW
jgi:hypothetical protein